MQAKVSVIIPIYNKGVYLRQCLESLKAQTLADIEFICVNDGSSDGNDKILAELASDTRFKVIYQAHIGTGAARNKGIELAQGEYIGFVDADDWVAEDYFAKLYAQAQADKADICCALQRKDIYANKTVETTTPWHGDIALMKKQLILTAGHLWSKLFKRAFVEQHHLRNATTRRTQDIAFSVPAILQAERISAVKDTFYYYRISEDSASHQAIERQDCFELGEIFKLILAQEYADNDAIKLIRARLQADTQYYLNRTTNFKNKIIIFKSLIKNVPSFKWAGTYQMAYKTAKILNLLGL
ncbi:MAG: glycosyltransferase [Alphaproteobacteria bacterium]|nr:glycosyltransferase [Alphaproteobacteria bacterium]